MSFPFTKTVFQLPDEKIFQEKLNGFVLSESSEQDQRIKEVLVKAFAGKQKTYLDISFNTKSELKKLDLGDSVEKISEKAIAVLKSMAGRPQGSNGSFCRRSDFFPN